MYSILTVAVTSFILLIALVLIAIYKKTNKKPIAAQLLHREEDIEGNHREGLVEPPTPPKLPIIGHMHLLGGHEVPYQAFTALSQKYGPIFKLQLGQVKSVVVNEQKNIKEVLVTRGHHFDFRPNFERYQQLFSGNKENSLAFCDWSKTQKVRRDMLKVYTFPRAFTNKYATLNDIILQHSDEMTTVLDRSKGEAFAFKPLLLRTCANIFLSHFCSERFDLDDGAFGRMVANFDEIFYEVNQGYAADFLPFLMPFHRRKMERMSKMTHEIRDFINTNVIKDKYQTHDPEVEPTDYLQSLIGHVKQQSTENKDASLDWEMALFALEDIIGGHSAVGNFLMKLLGFLATRPDVQQKIQQEIQTAVGTDRPVNISDRNQLVYTEAVIYEALRLIASPIVPRVANQTSSIDGYKIEKGTLIFLNNYDLSMSNELWESPEEFVPERFLKDGKIHKPDHFLPFGGGRRSCMGYKLVQLVTLGILGVLMQHFHLRPVKGENYKVAAGSLALKQETYRFAFEKR